MRLSDLEVKITENPRTLLPHLERLNESRLLDYQSIEANKRINYYQLKPGIVPNQLVPLYRTLHTMSNAVYKILSSNSGNFLTSEDIANFLPKEITEGWTNKEGLIHSVSLILKNLEKEGLAIIQQFQGSMRSEINLSEEQRTIISELIQILDSFQDQDPQILEQGRKLAGEIWTDPEKVSSLMLRAKNASGNANKWSSSETEASILSIIQRHPEGMTNRQIREELEKIYNKNLGLARLLAVTSALTKNNVVVVQTSGKQQIFFPVLPPQE